MVYKHKAFSSTLSPFSKVLIVSISSWYISTAARTAGQKAKWSLESSLTPGHHRITEVGEVVESNGLLIAGMANCAFEIVAFLWSA